jgi:hypothetical protein
VLYGLHVSSLPSYLSPAPCSIAHSVDYVNTTTLTSQMMREVPRSPPPNGTSKQRIALRRSLILEVFHHLSGLMHEVKKNGRERAASGVASNNTTVVPAIKFFSGPPETNHHSTSASADLLVSPAESRRSKCTKPFDILRVFQDAVTPEKEEQIAPGHGRGFNLAYLGHRFVHLSFTCFWKNRPRPRTYNANPLSVIRLFWHTVHHLRVR